MRCLTIRQPWATLIALGEKRFETRSWRASFRGELAIHAGLKIDKAACLREPFQSVLESHGYTIDNLPTGAIIAVVKVKACHAISATAEPTAEGGWSAGHEAAFGDYAEGRYAWELEEVRPLKSPIPAKGRLGLWEHELENIY